MNVTASALHCFIKCVTMTVESVDCLYLKGYISFVGVYTYKIQTRENVVPAEERGIICVLGSLY